MTQGVPIQILITKQMRNRHIYIYIFVFISFFIYKYTEVVTTSQRTNSDLHGSDIAYLLYAIGGKGTSRGSATTRKQKKAFVHVLSPWVPH